MILAILLSCAADLPQVTMSGPPMQDVTVVVGRQPETIQLRLAGAWVDDDGAEGRGVDVAAELSGKPPLEIRGDRSSWSLKDGIVVFEGEVVATRGDVVLRCARLEVTYADDRVQTALASGGVTVEHAARRATASRAQLTVSDGRIVLTGSPEVRDGPNRLEGEPITLFLDDERIECDGCKLVIDGAAVAPARR